MAEFKIYLTADTKSAQHGINQVVGSVESLRKQYISGKTSVDNYNQALNNQLAMNNEMLSPLKSYEANVKLLHTELSRLSLAFGENNSTVQDISKAYNVAQESLKKYKEELATINQQTQDRETKAQLEAEQKAIEDTRKYYIALGDSMGYAQNEANILNNALKKTISAGGSDAQIQDAANAYLKQRDAIAEVSKQEEAYLAQVQNAINQEKAREQAVEDANNASLESWKRYTDFVAQQQAKLNALNTTSTPTESSMKMGNYSSSNANMSFYKAIGDNVSYTREEVSLYENELKRLLSLEGDHTEEIDRAVVSYKNAQSSLESMTKATSSQNFKLLEIAKNILKFQLILGPIRKALNFVTQTLSDSVSVAAEAEQVFNKLSTVFENNAIAMGKAQDMAQSYGTSISTMASSLSTVGDMLQAQGMSKSESLELASQWTEMFSDIVAFKDINMSVEEFATNFMSGATGNLRNFRTFGSIVKESAVNAELAKRGLSGLTGEELELEKMVIRATLALEQQANAVGATEREWETALSVARRLNEQWKQWKENLGDVINKALTPMKSWLSDILSEANQVTNAMKEINSGEFTIKYETVASDDAIKKLFITTVGSRVDGDSAFTSAFWEDIRQRTVEATTMQYAPIGQNDYTTLTAKDVVNISRATGASIEKIKEIYESTGGIIQRSYALEENIWEKAQTTLDAEIALAKREESRSNQLQKLQEFVIKDYKNTLTAMFTNTGEMASWLKGDSFVDHTSAEYVLGKNKGTAEENVSTSTSEIAQILNYIRTTLPTLTSKKTDLEAQLAQAQADFNANAVVVDGAVYGNGNGWSQEEAKQQYEIIQTIQKQIKAIDSTTATWIAMDDELTDTLKKLYEQGAKDTATASVTSSTEALNATIASNAKRDELEAQYTDSLSYMVDILMQEYEYEQEYAKLLQNLITAGYTEDEATAQLVEYKDAYGKIIQRLIKKGEEEANKPDTTARDNALKSAQEGTADYQKQLRQLYMSEPQKTIDDLSENLGKYDAEVDEAINKQIQAYEELYNAQQKYTKELENAEAWKALGQNALSSLGTVGGAINTIAYGDGDIWTRILEVCLDIFQQSEYFAEIVALIDKLIEPMLPIVEAIFYTISSLEPLLEPLVFVLKVIASLVTEVLFVVNMIIDIFEWFWDNLKIALKNVAVDVYNLFHLRKKDREDYKALTDYWGETIAQTNAILEKIWNKVPTNDDADFSTLENLLKSGIINLDQYNAGLRVQQKDMIFDPVAPVEYIASTPQGETTIKYGDVTVVINGGSKEEIQSVLINVMRKAGYDVSNVPITA